MEIEQIENYINIQTTVSSMFLDFFNSLFWLYFFLLVHVQATCTTCPKLEEKKNYCGKICTELSRLNHFSFRQFILKIFWSYNEK